MNNKPLSFDCCLMLKGIIAAEGEGCADAEGDTSPFSLKEPKMLNTVH